MVSGIEQWLEGLSMWTLCLSAIGAGILVFGAVVGLVWLVTELIFWWEAR
jgi:hypothetical protein